MSKKEFLVAMTGASDQGAFRLVRARSKSEISKRVPGAEVLDPAPEWLTEEHLNRLRSGHVFDIDEPLDVHMLTQPPDLVFDRDDPPPGAQIIRDPEALDRAREIFQERG